MFIVIKFMPLELLNTSKNILLLAMHFNITGFIKPHENETDGLCKRRLHKAVKIYTRQWLVIKGESGKPPNYIRYDILLDNSVNTGLHMYYVLHRQVIQIRLL
jgi:hypothetical protein